MTFPGDGILLDASASVDEALLTGEARPVHRNIGVAVVAGSFNLAGPVRVRLTAVGAGTRFAQIVALMERAATEKPRLAILADRIAALGVLALGALAREISAIDEASWRSHPGGIPGNSALPLITTDGDPDSDQVTGAMRPTPWLERLPYLMQVLETLGATWGRSRLMRLSGQSEVTGHVDINYYWREHMRVHVPIVTTPSVRFQCGEDEVNMAAGECWIFDTWRLHRVHNDDHRSRIHLVADTTGNARFWAAGVIEKEQVTRLHGADGGRI